MDYWDNIENERGEGMKIAKIISIVDEMRPNQYELEDKTRWLSEVEGLLVDSVFNLAEGNDILFEKYEYEMDAEKELMLPDRYSDIYIHYLKAKIEFSDGETEAYNNEVAAYQSAFDQFAAWYRRNHMPKNRAHFVV